VQRTVLVGLGLGAALVLAALAGVERVAGRHPNTDVPAHAASSPEPSLPSAIEGPEAEPSASPVLTR
jgi:hypothetical protein